MGGKDIVHQTSESQREAMLAKSIEFNVFVSMRIRGKKTAIHIQIKWQKWTQNTGQKFRLNKLKKKLDQLHLNVDPVFFSQNRWCIGRDLNL